MSSHEKKKYASCFVPQCKSSTISTPDKIFFSVPRVKEKVDTWFRLARREKSGLSLQAARYCCQDHFKLEEDTENWMRYKIMKESGVRPMQLRLKTDAVPRFFDCQVDRKRAHTKPPRSAVLKRTSKEAVQAAVENAMDSDNSSKNGEAAMKKLKIQSVNVSPSVDTVKDLASEIESPSTSTSMTDTLESECTNESQSSCNFNLPTPSPLSSRFFMSSAFTSSFGLPTARRLKHTFTSDVGVQVRPQIRSKGNQMGISVFEPGRLPATFKPPNAPLMAPDEPARFRAPAQPPPLPEYDIEEYESDTDSVADQDNASSYHPDTTLLSEEWEEAEKLIDAELRDKSIEYNIRLMLRKCKRYLGIDPQNISILNLLQSFTGHKREKIMLVLRKIRMNEPNDVLGDIFGYCESTVGIIIRSVLPDVAACIKTYVFWPKEEVIRSNLPIAFRANYGNVQSIIDCFEIQIAKPSRPSHQAATWSDYKKCNTVKYLLSITPDCFINFISPGYGGRATDVAIVKKSGFLDILPPNITVMADRGFKNIGPFLRNKNCSLEKPPSCPAGEKMTEADVRQTKVIASLRIHVERVIRRLREYSFLDAHSRFHQSMFGMIDDIVVIACGLSNIQGSLIR